MRKTTFLLAVALGLLLSYGIQSQAGILITEVKTIGWASALSGIGYQSWDAEELGDYAAYASAHSNQDPGGTHMASSTASVNFHELDSTIEISSFSSASSETSRPFTSSYSYIQLNVTLDRSFAFSITGSMSASHELPAFLLRDDRDRRYIIGDSGIVGPGSLSIEGRCNSSADTEGLSTFDEYSAIVSLIPLSAGDFDQDGDVDGADFLAWQRDPSIGSLNDWQTNYGSNVSISGTSSAVPEPCSFCVVALAGSAISFQRKLSTLHTT